MELHNKKDANGNILRSMDCNLDEIERSDCFGTYDGDIECECCDNKKECKKEKRDWIVLAVILMGMGNAIYAYMKENV